MDVRPGYREWAPPPTIGDAVACLWMRAAPVGPAASTAALVLPDACSDLIWQSGRGPFVAGPDTGPQPTTLAPGTVLIGARFRPGAGGPALGTSLAAWRNRRVDRPELASALGGELAPETAARRLVEVVADLVDAGPLEPLVAAATHSLEDPAARVADVAATLDTSERHLRRRLVETVGYGPKTLQRVLRFRRFIAYASVRGRDHDLATLAHSAGYADQAHLTRECRRLSGLTPHRLVRQMTF